MESCWAGQPSQRPLLGLVEPVIQSIKLRYEQGRSVMPDRFSSRKKRPTRLSSWPNPEDLKLENLPIGDKAPPSERRVIQRAKTEDDLDTKTIQPEKPPPTQIVDVVTSGLATGMTDIDRTVCVNRDQLTVTNVFVESPKECLLENGNTEGATLSPDETNGRSQGPSRKGSAVSGISQGQFQLPAPQFLTNNGQV